MASSRALTVVTVLGTRPDAIKLAPVVAALREAPGDFRCLVAATGQHRELLQQVLAEFSLAVDVDLDLMRDDQHPADVLSRCLGGLDRVVVRTRPALVLVQGDTTTALAGALAAFYRRVPVAHVEAGLRTGHPALPFPEELHRRLIGRIADLHFAPTLEGRRALEEEGVDPGAIFVTGNTVIDAVRRIAGPRRRRPAGDSPMLLVTLHRRESWGRRLAVACRAVRRLLERYPALEAVIPVHPNPRVRATVEVELRGQPRAHVVSPPPYGRFLSMLARSTLVLTDSGGIQEEAVALGVPVLVARDVTERPEGVRAGVARLVGLEEDAIVREGDRILADRTRQVLDPATRDLYGDGEAAWRIVGALRFWAGRDGERPADFAPRAGALVSAGTREVAV